MELWPNLAGQGHTYLVKQLKEFHNGTRKDPLMEPMAKPLSEQDMENLAAYYAGLKPAPASTSAKADVAAGQKLSSTCENCHGPNGVSIADAWPNLAAQRHDYLVKQLKAFRAGTRKDPLMSPLALSLSDKDMEDVAAFYATRPGSAPSEPASEGGATAAAVVPHPPIVRSDFIVPRARPTRQYWADQLPAGEGKEITVRKCQLCHDSQRTIAFARTRSEWQHVVESMTHRGTPLTPEEKPVLIDYYTKYFGMDSTPIIGPKGVQEVGMTPCKPSDWPKGAEDFRNWKGAYTVWLSNHQGASIDIVDPTTNRIVRQIKCVSAPDRVEFSGDGNTAYAPDRVEHNVTVIDTRTGAIKAKIPLLARPNTASLDKDAHRLYVAISPVRADENERGYVQVIDTQSLKVVDTIETKGAIHYAKLSPDRKLVLAISPEARFMNVYESKTQKLLYSCCNEAAIGDMHAEAAPDGSTSRILFSYSGFNGIVAVDAKTGKEVTRVMQPLCDKEGPYKGVRHEKKAVKPSGFHGGEISGDGKFFWVMQGSFVFRYELPSLKPAGHVHLAMVDQVGRAYSPASEGTRLTVSPDGQKVYAARPGRNLISVIDAKRMEEEALIPTGEYPLNLSIWPRGAP